MAEIAGAAFLPLRPNPLEKKLSINSMAMQWVPHAGYAI